jgi:hypothetical protein
MEPSRIREIRAALGNRPNSEKLLSVARYFNLKPSQVAQIAGNQ